VRPGAVPQFERLALARGLAQQGAGPGGILVGAFAAAPPTASPSRPTHTCLSLAPATGAPTGGGMGESRAKRGPASLPPEGIMGACIAGKPNKFGAATGLAERMGGHASICTAPATSHSSLARRLQTNEPSARRQVGREAR
jgi:hypothetical protein